MTGSSRRQESNSESSIDEEQEPSTVVPETKLYNPFINASSNGIIGNVITSIVPEPIHGTLGNLLESAENCIAKDDYDGFQDPELGDFITKKDSLYCHSNCTRHLICCAPQTPGEIGVQFIYSNSRTSSRRIGLNDRVSPNKKIVWVVHGFLNNYTEDSAFNDTKDAYIDRGFDVIVVDWSLGNRLYLQSLANVRVVGALVGQMMVRLGVIERSLCAGFSLGAHVCGEAGKWVKRNSNKVIWKCHGLDPAGPGFDGCDSELRLDPSDCKTVISMHTSQYNTVLSLLGKSGLGTKYRTGHCDFWMNDAITQPNCANPNATLLGIKLNILKGKFGKIAKDVDFSCSHSRAMQYYISYVNQECEFTGYHSEGCGEANSGGCKRVKKPFHELTEDQPQRKKRGQLNWDPFGLFSGSSSGRPSLLDPLGIFSGNRPSSRPLASLISRPTNEQRPSRRPQNNQQPRLPRIMNLFSEECKPGLLVDYQVDTTGNEPFCLDPN